MRRTLTIAAIVIILVGAGVAVYFYFFRSTAGISVTSTEGTGFPVAGGVTGNFGTDSEQEGIISAGSPVKISSRLVKISAGPVALGEAVVDNKAINASSSPEVAVKYIERQSGNVFSYLVRAGTLTRTSNKTLPSIQTASWLPDGSLAFVRYLSGNDFSTINTYALAANGSSGEMLIGQSTTTKQNVSVGGFFLPQNLVDIAVSGANILSLASGVNGSVASLTRTDGTRATTVFTMPLSSSRVSFAGKNQYLAFTKPSATLPGSAFLIDGTGHFSRIAGPKIGLVALASPSGKWVLVSSIEDNAMRMELVNAATGEILPLPIATIAEKCVWTADDSTIYCGVPVNPSVGFNYPDDWYQGAIAFNDRIWKVQVSGRYAQLVLDFPAETKNSLDAEALAINPAGTVLVFVNKNEGSLWSYQL